MASPRESETQRRNAQQSGQENEPLGQPPEEGELLSGDEGFEPETPKGSVERLRKWMQRLGQRLNPQQGLGREAKAKSGGRTLIILAGSVIGCVLLFGAIFTTTTGEGGNRKRKTTPRLGRPMAQTDNSQAQRSIVPQLNADQQSGGEPGELSESDVLDTMRNKRGAPQTKAPNPEHALSNVEFGGPALEQAYRRRGQTAPPPRNYIVPTTNPAPPPPLPTENPDEGLEKPSIVFVRTRTKGATGGLAKLEPAISRRITGLLPQGTRLVARLQHAVSSAAEMPVTAVIEYNYEHDGHLIVPAGSKAYGELTRATPKGWVEMKFHALELPGGRQEKITGSALNLELGPLRGHVNGKNTAKKFLVRTLQGVGSVASYMVGGGSFARGQFDGSILLRERMADNIARAGEEELRRLAYQQHIVVTVPANTRFYLVLHDRAIAAEDSQDGVTSAVQGLSDREVEELVRLRNELQLMNRMMSRSP
ncbi:MAG: TrbI/VirB10 family protein [bacterium]|nr:TrbI/VirB10 family protein [bacterium]